ncbi:hypothetical protein ACQ4LE_005328, partial [Meloidogyne hapla]
MEILFKEFNRILLILIFIIFNLYFKQINGELLDEDLNEIHLTDMKKTQYSISYLSMDQCMLRPSQTKLGSFALKFEWENLLTCNNGILICYPSQLVGTNTINGTIPSIPYRLRISRQNNITKQCESKRKEFCKENNFASCNETHWHGIFVQTVKFKIIVSLSITNKIYDFNPMNFSLQFGRKEDIFTRIFLYNTSKGTLKEEKEDDLLRDEYISNIHKGAYLHKYSGLWSLGFDLLPTSSQRILHLFVYRSCGCAIKAFFIKPTTKQSLQKFTKKSIHEKNCQKLFTNETIQDVGEISKNIIGKMITFSILTANDGKIAKFILIKSKKNNIIEITLNKTSINFGPYSNYYGKWNNRTNQLNKKIFADNNRIDFIILIQRYCISIEFTSGNWSLINLFWPNKCGDFILISNLLVYVPIMKQISKKLMPKQAPISFRLKTELGKDIKITFRGLPHKNASYFKINLLYAVPEANPIVGETVLEMNVDFKQKTIKLSELHYQYLNENEKILANNVFDVGKPFECTIIGKQEVQEYFYKEIFTYYTIIINDDIQTIKYIGSLPVWRIERASLDGDIQVLEEPLITYKEDYNKSDYYVYKHEMETLQKNGTLLLLDGFVQHDSFKKKDDKSISFFVFLLHDASEYNIFIGKKVLMLNFIFNDETDKKLPANKCNNKSMLILANQINNGTKIYWDMDEYYNPIGQTGVFFSLRIDSDDTHLKISVNNGSYLYYKHHLPPWAVNWISVHGYITDVNFGKIRYELPQNIRQISRDKSLGDGSYINIEGNISEPLSNISVNLFHNSLEHHKYISTIVLQLNLTKCCIKGSYYWPLDNLEHLTKSYEYEKELHSGEMFRLKL